uniref:Uncharacterized protein n=2 Tax=Grammatophora oceanica TaxID=210454 RepID=A0A7S1VME7_9STRA
MSIAAQFGIHLGLILVGTEISLTFVDPYDPSITPDAAFYPNVLNTCTFLLTMVATINTFAVNYRGKPFMQDLRDNTMLKRSLQLCYAVLFICALEVFPPLNDLFQLSPFPDTSIVLGADGAMDDDWIGSLEDAPPLAQLVGQAGFQLSMAGLLLVDTIAVFAVERIILRVFD